jgi:phosphatidylinositol glycan class B
MPATPPDPQAPLPRAGWLVLAASIALSLAFALRGYGVFWPDEIYQSLEPGHRLAFGYGFLSWEFQRGARSWIFPGVLAAVLRLGAALGHTPAALLIAVKTFMVLTAAAGLLASMRLAQRLAGPRAALLAGVLGAGFPPALIMSGRAMSELPSGAALAFAAWLSLDPRASRLRTAGALAVLATFLRAPDALVLVGLGVTLLARRRARPFVEGAAAAGLVAGALDWATWGAPFHSLLLAVRYNLIAGHASEYGRAGLGYYFGALASSTGPAIAIVGAGLLRAPRPARPLLAVALAPVLVHLALPHKELRFLMPFVPILFAVAAAGLDGWMVALAARLPRLRPAPAVSLLAGTLGALMIGRAPGLTYADLGSTYVPQPQRAAGTYGDGFNRLLMQLHDMPDLCGVAVAGAQVIWLGGSTPLHRNVPFFDLDPPRPEGSPAANYVLAPSSWSRPPAATLIARNDEAALYRYDRPCAPPPPGYNLFELPPD